jgi:hypothetical protein
MMAAEYALAFMVRLSKKIETKEIKTVIQIEGQTYLSRRIKITIKRGGCKGNRPRLPASPCLLNNSCLFILIW